MNIPEPTPPIDNRFVAPGCEPFHHLPLTPEQIKEQAASKAPERFDRIREIVTESGKFPYSDENIADVVAHVFASHRRMCDGLQECVQKHNLGLCGENVDEITIRALEESKRENAELRAALKETRQYLPSRTEAPGFRARIDELIARPQ